MTMQLDYSFGSKGRDSKRNGLFVVGYTCAKHLTEKSLLLISCSVSYKMLEYQ